MSNSFFSQIDWSSLLSKLTSCAAKWFSDRGCSHEEDVLPATGKSAKELSFDTVAKFINNEIRWNPKTGNNGLFRVLKEVMWHDFLDLIKDRREFDRTDVLDVLISEKNIDEGKVQKRVLSDIPDETCDGYFCIEAAILGRRIYPLIKGEQELIDYVDAVLKCGFIKREDILAVLEISPQEATNRRARLRVKLASWYRKVKISRVAKGH